MTTPTTSRVSDAQREAFEKWVRKNTEYDLELRPDGQYMFGGAFDLWLGWQAALASLGDVVACAEVVSCPNSGQRQLVTYFENGAIPKVGTKLYTITDLSTILNRGGK